MTKPAHTLSAVIDRQWLNVAITCHEPEGAPCRMWCPEQCESWIQEDHEHELVDYGECLAVEWIDNLGSCDESHGGESTPIHDGMAVDVEWNGDGWIWKAVTA